MLLISGGDEEAEVWISHIKEYQTLLREQSVGFDVTRLASIRMNLLSKVGKRDEESTPADGGGTPDPVAGYFDQAEALNSALLGQEQMPNEDSNSTNSFMRQNLMAVDPFMDTGNLDWLADLTFMDELGD